MHGRTPRPALTPPPPPPLPSRSTADELERCSRTVYMANVDRHIGGGEVRRFFEQLCGPVSRLRLLKEVQNSESRIAFVEFDSAEGALAALKCSGAVLGALALRISPSKTPVRESSGDEARRTKASAAASAAGAGPGSGGGPGGAAMSMPLAVVSLPLSVLP
jgi:hypothetical protein